MQHLFNSVVRVKRNQMTVVNGTPQIGPVYMPAPLDYIKCRLDLLFVRVGKDQLPSAMEAGRAPDRTGVMFVSASVPIKAGDILETVSGPVTGNFEIRAIPDIAVGFSSAHHIEVQIFETNQVLTNKWPTTKGTEMIGNE